MADLLIYLVVSFLGACIGVLWEPKSPDWALWQKRGIWTGLVALGAFLLATAVAVFTDDSPLFWPMFIIGLAALVTFLVIGNVCRHYHEKR